MALNEDQTYGFNLALEIYTRMITDNKELITGVIAIAYSQGIQDGIRYAQQLAIAQQQEQEHEHEQEQQLEPVEYVPEQVSIPKEKVWGDRPTNPEYRSTKQPPKITEQEMADIKKSSPAEELIAKMKGVKR